jgi:hypothetical protein
MKKKREKKDGAVRVRLSAAQIDTLAPGIGLLVHSYTTRMRSGSSPLAYPFRIYPPTRDFDRGCYEQAFMDKTLALWQVVKSKPKNGRRMNLDTWELRTAMFAIRVYVDYVRLLRNKHRRKSREVKAALHIDDKSFAQLKVKSHRLNGSLERHLKRANRASIQALGEEGFTKLTMHWKAHLKWMRLHIAYCKPWAVPHSGRRKRAQRDLDELMEIAKLGLREFGYKPPQDKELRHLMRLYARYARDGRIGNWAIGFLHEDKERFSRRYYLAQFVIDRSKPKEFLNRDEEERNCQEPESPQSNCSSARHDRSKGPEGNRLSPNQLGRFEPAGTGRKVEQSD